MSMLKDFLKPKIATKLTGWFLLITLVPLAVIVYLANDRGKEQLQHEIMNKLVVMTVERVSNIETYIRETQRTLELLVLQPSAIRALEILEEAASSISRHVLLEVVTAVLMFSARSFCTNPIDDA